MSKQTAINWLFKKLFDEPKDKLTWYAILEQAKEMDKQQTIDFAKDWWGDDSDLPAKEYYNETFNK